MKKIKLRIEKLSVERFEVQPEATVERGTVHGFATQSPDTCYCGSMGPSDPCLYCVEMPLTWSCDPAACA